MDLISDKAPTEAAVTAFGHVNPNYVAEALATNARLYALFRTACAAGNLEVAQMLYAHPGFGGEAVAQVASYLWRRREHYPIVKWLIDQTARRDVKTLASKDMDPELMDWWASDLTGLYPPAGWRPPGPNRLDAPVRLLFAQN